MFHIVVVSKTVAIYMQLSECPITHLSFYTSGNEQAAAPLMQSVHQWQVLPLGFLRLDDWPKQAIVAGGISR